MFIRYWYVTFMHGNGRGTITYGSELAQTSPATRPFFVGEATEAIRRRLNLPLPPTILSWTEISESQHAEFSAYIQMVVAREQCHADTPPNVQPLHPPAKVVKLPTDPIPPA